MKNIEHEITPRLQLLEEKFEYQERTLETLNDVIIDQQSQINSLSESLEKLRGLLAANLTQLEQEDPPPPHY